MPGDETRSLVERARSGDPDAWEVIYRRAYPRLLAFARRRLATSEQADDAVSEAMARAIASVARFEWGPAGLDGWLFGILRNVVLEAYRHQARPGAPQGDPTPALAGAQADGPQPGEQLLAQEVASDVSAAFARLEPSDQELLELRVVAGLDAAQVGAILGKRPGAVRMAQARALERLRARLGEAAR